MKKLCLLFIIAAFSGFYSPDSPLTKKERKFAANHLKETRNDLAKTVEGLSEAQLNFKPAPDRWSIKECVYHLAISETAIWQWIDATIKAPANPEKRADIKMTDEQVLQGIANREHKIKTSEAFEPKNAKWANVDEALKDMKENRKKAIDYINTTNEELRNHVATETPLGALDAYQLVLLLSQHTNRHMQQINEVKADPNFPKS